MKSFFLPSTELKYPSPHKKNHPERTESAQKKPDHIFNASRVIKFVSHPPQFRGPVR